MPELDAYARHADPQQVVVIGISVDRPQARSAVEKVAATLAYPIALASEAESDGFGMPEFLPVTYIIDSKGTVRLKLTPESGALSRKGLEAQVNAVRTGHP
jgi:peroxiredoxin